MLLLLTPLVPLLAGCILLSPIKWTAVNMSSKLSLNRERHVFGLNIEVELVYDAGMVAIWLSKRKSRYINSSWQVMLDPYHFVVKVEVVVADDTIQIWHPGGDTLMECLHREDGFSKGEYPSGCHICFILPNKPQFGKISMKTTICWPYQ